MPTMANNDNNDDDFEDIFSFGSAADATANASEAASNANNINSNINNNNSNAPSTSPNMSDFDIDGDDDDDFFSAPTENAAPQTPGASAQQHVNPSTTAATTTTTTPRGHDVFDDIFGTPPATPLTPSKIMTPMDNNADIDNFFNDSDDDDGGDGVNTTSKNNINNNNSSHSNNSNINNLTALPTPAASPARAHLSSDDFHPHDADTRDFLEWLDDDDAGKKKGEHDATTAAATTTTTIKSNVVKNEKGVDISMEISGEGDSFGVALDGITDMARMEATTTTNEKQQQQQKMEEVGNVDEFGEEDDFDFDQMLAEADAKSGLPMSKVVSSNKGGGVGMEEVAKQQQLQQQPPPLGGDAIATALGVASVADAECQSQSITNTNTNTNTKNMSVASSFGETPGVIMDVSNIMEGSSMHSTDVDSSSGMVTPVPLSKPYVSACIEEELALDQWDIGDDDDNDNDHDDNAVEGNASLTCNTNVDNATANIHTMEGAATTTTIGNKTTRTTASPTKPTIVFTSLSDAIRSNASTTDDVRALFSRERGRTGNAAINDDVGVLEKDRPYLWTKVICGKVLDDIENGSMADSFREWQKKDGVSDGTYGGGESDQAIIDALLTQACSIDNADGVLYEEKKRNLLSLLHFHDRDKKAEPASSSIDPLIPPVANAILSAGISPAAASVVLSSIEPSAMPLLRLTHNERILAAKALHADFYLLACYHLPLLVMHLDRHCPGWYWPRKENNSMEKKVEEEDKMVDEDVTSSVAEGDAGEKESGLDTKVKEEGGLKSEQVMEKKDNRAFENNGLVPLSWFVTNFAGGCGGTCLDHKYLLPLWDNLLTKGDCSWKYFLAIAVLNKHSDVLLMSRGDELSRELEKVLNFKESSFEEESFVGGSSGEEKEASSDQLVSEWLSRAKSLIECTPSSVIERLRTADDRAVTDAIKTHQDQANEKLQAQLDKESKAHEAALKKERDEREAEAKKAMIRARLTAYYRNHNPEKVDTLDDILKMFDGRIEVLNEKLKKKYGEGFLPPVHPDEAISKQTRSFLISVNQSMNVTKKHVAITLAERRKRSAKATIKTESYTPVALEVSPTEVIPLICSTKGHHVKIQSPRSASGSENALKFYLVDCRPASTAKEQGRFPTSVELSPEKLQDPDALQHLTDMFESLRGAVHICVMGEGFASFPTLYDHPLTKGEGKLLEDDISRTSSCALFFLKKGFPFVSVLKGGFAAAHAFLSRNGPSLDLAPSDVLIDYDPVVSLFAQLEVARQEQEEYKNAPAREKTVRTLQKIIDSSMTRLTVEEQRINDLASDLSKPETVDKMKQSVSNFFARAHQHTPSTQRDESSLSFGRTPPLFMSKKLSEAKKDEEAKEKLTTNQDDALVNSLSRFTEKMSFKRQHENTDLSATGSSNEIVDTDQIESITPKENDTTPESNKVKATEGHSAMSNAFSSFAQRIQHSHKPAPPPSENKEMLSGENAMAKDSTESKTLPTAQLGQAKSSFSLFAQKIAAAKQRDASKAAAATPTGITATDNAEKPESRENILDDKNESDNLPTVQPEQAKSSFSMFAGKIAAIKAASATATATATEDPTTGSGPTLESQDHDSVEKAELVEPSSVKTNLSPTVQPEQAKSSFSMFAERIAGIKAASATATATATEDPTTGSGPTLESQYHDSEGKADLVEPSSVKTNPSSTVQLEQAKSSFSMFTQKIAIMKTVSTTATVDSATVDPANISGETPESQDHDSEEKGEVVETSPIKANLAASKNLFSTFASKIAEVKSSEGNSDAAQGKSEPTKNPFANFSLKKSTNQQTSNPSIIETNSTTANAESTSNDGTETTTKKTFASFTKSFGSGNQNQAANRNPFASLMQSKADTAKEGEASSISTKLSLGKFLSEQNDPFGPSSFGFKGKTRFSSPNTSTETKSAKTDAISASEEAISYQHDDEEEAISFQHEDDDDDEQEVIDLLGGDVFEADSSTSMEAESQVENQTNDLFLGLDPQPHGDPMKDLFGDDPFGVVEEN